MLEQKLLVRAVLAVQRKTLFTTLFNLAIFLSITLEQRGWDRSV